MLKLETSSAESMSQFITVVMIIKKPISYLIDDIGKMVIIRIAQLPFPHGRQSYGY